MYQRFNKLFFKQSYAVADLFNGKNSYLTTQLSRSMPTPSKWGGAEFRTCEMRDSVLLFTVRKRIFFAWRRLQAQSTRFPCTG